MFSQTAQYALRAMTFLAGLHDEAANSERISNQMQIPKPYLSKLLSDLVRAKLVRARRGPNGGFVLSRAATEISILDVLSAVDPIERITQCPLGNPRHKSLCPLHRRLDNAMAMVEESFAVTGLHELIDPSDHARPVATADRKPSVGADGPTRQPSAAPSPGPRAPR